LRVLGSGEPSRDMVGPEVLRIVVSGLDPTTTAMPVDSRRYEIGRQ
jgi:hypothetical protein